MSTPVTSFMYYKEETSDLIEIIGKTLWYIQKCMNMQM